MDEDLDIFVDNYDEQRPNIILSPIQGKSTETDPTKSYYVTQTYGQGGKQFGNYFPWRFEKSEIKSTNLCSFDTSVHKIVKNIPYGYYGRLAVFAFKTNNQIIGFSLKSNHQESSTYCYEGLFNDILVHPAKKEIILINATDTLLFRTQTATISFDPSKFQGNKLNFTVVTS